MCFALTRFNEIVDFDRDRQREVLALLEAVGLPAPIVVKSCEDVASLSQRSQQASTCPQSESVSRLDDGNPAESAIRRRDSCMENDASTGDLNGINTVHGLPHSGAIGGTTPVVVTSARTGLGLTVLASCLGRLRPSHDWSALRRQPALLTIHGHHPPPTSADGFQIEVGVPFSLPGCC